MVSLQILFFILASAISETVIGFTRHSVLSYCRVDIKSTHSYSTVALHAISKKAEMYIKVKRLKQMIAEGKGYEGYIDEQKRYEKQDPSTMNTAAEGPEGVDGVEDVTAGELVEVKRKLLSLGLGTADPMETMKKVLKYQQDKADSLRASKKKSLESTASTSSVEVIEVTDDATENTSEGGD